MKLDRKTFSIETERLALVPVSLDRVEEMFSEFTDEITKYMYPTTPKKVDETEAFIRASMQGFLDGKEIVVMVLHKDTREYLGNAGIHHIDTKTPELGIWIKKGAHGNGYGRETVAGLKAWADENLAYEYLVYPVVEENAPSRKIAESLGGQIASIEQKEFQGGRIFSSVEYHIFPDKK